MTGSEVRQVRARLRDAFVWRGDSTDESRYADVTGWWRDPELLQLLGPALAGLFAEAAPTVVLGPDSRGSLIGPLVALHLRVGFVEVRKNRAPAADSDQWIRRTTPPDYRDRHLELGFRRDLIHSSDRVLVVDDWIDTGSQARTVHAMVAGAGATWVGVGCVVDALDDPRLRRDLRVRSLLHRRDL
ncbi:phosphoribosyltransferase family protein [Dactylosporangium cerinum]|uniref:Phosphoribosyltransferase family protein n=1 Tax=Dactylosporangium cerinum TaxID=1434730 RepID=A0ABV9W5H6_9ACTN